MKKEEKAIVYWLDYMDAYLVYKENRPDLPIAYVDSLEEAIERATEEGYIVQVESIKDIDGKEYELYSGKIYISKNRIYGNVAAYVPADKNNCLHVIYSGKLTKENIERAIISNGWKLEDWL